VGVSLPAGGLSIEPAVRLTFGSIDLGRESSGATGVGFSVTLGRR
jgi:hypothetical protein